MPKQEIGATRLIERINALSTVIMALCTVVIAIFAYYSMQLSRDMLLVNIEPLVETEYVKLDDNSRISFTVHDRSSIDLYNGRVYERFYTSPLAEYVNEFETPVLRN